MDCHNPRDFQIYIQRKYPTDNETSEMTGISHSLALQIFVLQKYEVLTSGQTEGAHSPRL